VAARVWLANAQDLETVSSLVGAFRDWWGKDEPSSRQIRETVGVLLEDQATDFLLASRGDREAAEGVCQLRYRLSVWTSVDDCWLEDLYVEDEARGSGLGRALVGAALERAEARGCRRVELDVNEENTGAIAFYDTLGLSTESKPPGRNLLVGRKLGTAQ
jgi:ribosomal protein S18 acetylase RimI-like enzyme